ncbi:hypothetical protein LSTR_LSTR005130 [Laodelphax striatellus]|uniref:Secreted protein n=1 Tax=Laodelphax striatellus TaxID=195883 RepID=A0A482WQS3_LAOST|nr:hypothetical protein LSTR_LSTR005130 [Laodelphax striatellus]
MCPSRVHRCGRPVLVVLVAVCLCYAWKEWDQASGTGPECNRPVSAPMAHMGFIRFGNGHTRYRDDVQSSHTVYWTEYRSRLMFRD